MKKIFTLITLFLIGLQGYSQNGSNITVLSLMEMNSGGDFFERLIQSAVPNIAEEKQADFIQKAETLAATKKAEAKKFFEKKYTQKDIEEIYVELSQEDRISYSEKAAGFLKEWRSYKTQFQTEFKLLYNTYQK